MDYEILFALIGLYRDIKTTINSFKKPQNLQRRKTNNRRVSNGYNKNNKHVRRSFWI